MEEYRNARSGYSIDILVRQRSAAGSTAWAVEVDGPFYFLRDGRTPSGNTLLKRKQLGQLGYTVVPVPFWEWRVLKGVEVKRLYVVDKLRGGSEKRSSNDCGLLHVDHTSGATTGVGEQGQGERETERG